MQVLVHSVAGECQSYPDSGRYNEYDSQKNTLFGVLPADSAPEAVFFYAVEARYYIPINAGVLMGVTSLSAGIPRMPSTPALTIADGSPQLVERVMPPTIDSLLNQLMPITGGRSLSPSQQSAVIEAVVVSNSPLLKTGDGTPQIRVTVSTPQQQLELTSQLPLPVGARVQLKLTADNLATLLALTLPSKSGTNTAPSQPTNANPLPGAADNAATRTAGGGNPATLRASAALIQSLLSPRGNPEEPRQLIDQAIRQTLPQQQPIRALIPLVLSALKQPQALPKPLVESLNQLVRQLPTPDQMQHPQPLKQAMLNSGLFLESRLAGQQQAARPDTSTARTSPQGAAPGTQESAKELLNRDTKALIERILPQLQKLTGEKDNPPPNTPSTPVPHTYGPAGELSVSINMTGAAGHHRPHSRNGQPQQSVDVLLRQLSRQLMASLARTQLNQLDSLSNRQAISNDPQSPVNTWHLEIPILNGNRIDNLELQIEQRQSDADDQDGERKTAWSVMLNFDLHQLGKMQVQLIIIEKTVSAIVWSQLEPTHQQVRQHLQGLRADLEKVGVTVKKVECQLGLAPNDRMAFYRQLVDVHT